MNDKTKKRSPLYLIGVLIPILSLCSRFLPNHIARNFLIFLTFIIPLPIYLDRAESKKTKIGWFIFTIIAVIFELCIIYVLK